MIATVEVEGWISCCTLILILCLVNGKGKRGGQNPILCPFSAHYLAGVGKDEPVSPLYRVVGPGNGCWSSDHGGFGGGILGDKYGSPGEFFFGGVDSGLGESIGESVGVSDTRSSFAMVFSALVSPRQTPGKSQKTYRTN